MPRILVVDDDEGVRNLLEDVLGIANHEVDAAATVKAALALLRAQFLQPGARGPDAAGRLRYSSSRGSPAARYSDHHLDCLRTPFPQG